MASSLPGWKPMDFFIKKWKAQKHVGEAFGKIFLHPRRIFFGCLSLLLFAGGTWVV